MTKFIDSKGLSISELETEICIIGGGAAGITLATELASSFKVTVIESGGINGKNDLKDLNEANYDSNYRYREDFSNRFRHIGGSTNLWAGRLVPYVFDEKLDEEWGEFKQILPKFYSKSS